MDVCCRERDLYIVYTFILHIWHRYKAHGIGRARVRAYGVARVRRRRRWIARRRRPPHPTAAAMQRRKEEGRLRREGEKVGSKVLKKNSIRSRSRLGRYVYLYKYIYIYIYILCTYMYVYIYTHIGLTHPTAAAMQRRKGRAGLRRERKT